MLLQICKCTFYDFTLYVLRYWVLWFCKSFVNTIYRNHTLYCYIIYVEHGWATTTTYIERNRKKSQPRASLNFSSGSIYTELWCYKNMYRTEYYACKNMYINLYAAKNVSLSITFMFKINFCFSFYAHYDTDHWL